MMAAFDFSETLLSANLSKLQRFQGLKNTAELKDTITGIFNGCAITIKCVEGKTDEFRATLTPEIKTDDEIQHLLAAFQENTYVTLRNSVLREVVTIYLFILLGFEL